MSDPAVEAARRQLAAQFGQPWTDEGMYTFRVRTESAREALATIRELHALCGDCSIKHPHCEHCGPDTAWPCDTARLIYTSEELS